MNDILWVSASPVYGGAQIISEKLIAKIPGSTMLVSNMHRDKYNGARFRTVFFEFMPLRKSFFSFIVFLINYINSSVKLKELFITHKKIIAIDFLSLVYVSTIKLVNKDGIVFYYAHSAFKESKFNRIILSRFINKISYKVIVPSQYLKLSLVRLGVKSSKIFVVYNGVEKQNMVSINKKQKTTEIVIGHFGRINDQKGQDLYCEAIKKVIISTNCKIRAYFAGEIGDKDFFDKVNHIIDGYKNNIIYAGNLTNAEAVSLMNECDLIVCTSKYRENLPTVLLEALSLGKVVIGSNIGGIPEIIHDYKNGLLYKVNDVNDLAKKIKEVIDNKWFLEWRKNAYYSYEKSFSEKKFISEFEKVLFGLNI